MTAGTGRESPCVVSIWDYVGLRCNMPYISIHEKVLVMRIDWVTLVENAVLTGLVVPSSRY